MAWFCKHDWKVIKDEVTESPLEMIKRLGAGVSEADGLHVVRTLCMKNHIIILQCAKCGELDKTIVSNI